MIEIDEPPIFTVLHTIITNKTCDNVVMIVTNTKENVHKGVINNGDN